MSHGTSPPPRAGSTAVDPASHPAGDSGAIPPGGYLRSDGDGDNDDGRYGIEARETSDILFPLLGARANAGDRRAIIALVKRYYAAAAAGKGATACPLLDSTLADGLTASSGPTAGSAAGGCPTVLSSLFEQQRGQLVADQVSTMVVTDVRVKGNMGLALVGFRAAPAGVIHVKHERDAWKMNSLLDTGMS